MDTDHDASENENMTDLYNSENSSRLPQATEPDFWDTILFELDSMKEKIDQMKEMIYRQMEMRKSVKE